MRTIEDCISLEQVRDHLKFRASGLGLECEATRYKVRRVLLDDADADRLVVWWEHKSNTGGSWSVRDATPLATQNDRVKRLVEGCSEYGWAPVDIRRQRGFELVLETSGEAVFLNIIDGNHRAIAHQLVHQNFTDVPAFLCIHPDARSWCSNRV